MWLIKLSIERPVFISMVVLSSLVLGIISFARLGVDEFPSVDPPIITVITKYPGPDPEVSSNGNSTTSQGVDRNTAANGRIITVGVNVSF